MQDQTPQRHAKWHPVKKSPTGEIRALRVYFWLWLLSMLVATAQAFLVFEYVTLVSICSAVLGLLFASLAGVKASKLGARLTADDTDMLESFGEGDRYLVDVAILQEHTITGRDRGVMWWDSDRLNFNGHATSFSIAGGDVKWFNSRKGGAEFWGLVHRHTIDLEDEDGLEVSLTFAQVDDRLPQNDELRRLTAALHATRVEMKRGQLPPSEFGPGRATLFQLSVKLAVYVTVLGLLFFLIGVWVTMEVSPGLASFVAASYIFLAVKNPYVRAIAGTRKLQKRALQKTSPRVLP